MATSKNYLEEHLECAVCLEKFKEPKVLLCQHLFCKQCLERLVTTDDRVVYEITCPVCKQKSEVHDGDVSSLPSNYVINRLLSISIDCKPSCEKHDGESIKFFCRSCDQLICPTCAFSDHRDHECSLIKDIFAAEKEKILKVVEESRANICKLQASIDTLKVQEDDFNKNLMEINHEIDDFIEKQIELLKVKRQKLKDELRESALKEKDSLNVQMESFVNCHACATSSVEAIEQTLCKGSEVEILSAKNEMIQQLVEINSTAVGLEPRGKVFYSLETDSPLKEDVIERMANIHKYKPTKRRPYLHRYIMENLWKH